MKTIALANQKGGVGKTTTAASLGIGLSRQGKKVLLIDADAQGNLTQMLGWPQPDELSPTLSTLMEKIIAEQPIAPGEGILHHPSGVHLVPANIELSALEVTLVNTMSRETVLRQYLSTVADCYDYALIDCMPSLGSDAGVELFGRGHIQPAGTGGLGKVCRPYRQGNAGVMSDLLLSGPAVGRTSVPAFLPFPAAIR